jgi:hypothetical protein
MSPRRVHPAAQSGVRDAGAPHELPKPRAVGVTTA